MVRAGFWPKDEQTNYESDASGKKNRKIFHCFVFICIHDDLHISKAIMPPPIPISPRPIALPTCPRPAPTRMLPAVPIAVPTAPIFPSPETNSTLFIVSIKMWYN